MHEYELQGSVAHLRFDDGKANVVGHDFIDAMLGGLERARGEAQAVVVSGREGMFSGGFDLKELQKGPAESARLVGRGVGMFLEMFRHPQPLLAACTGHAIAAGAFALLACDTRFAAAGDYKFGLNETAIGMSLPVFGFQLADARLSRRHMTQAVTQSTIYDPSSARDAGFIDTIVEGDVITAALAEAERLGEFETTAYAANKIGWRAPFIAAIEASLADFPAE
ncbi:MAG: crotonase/enoyl-CoA hydratase family protein [Pseudomonadota bacterium]